MKIGVAGAGHLGKIHIKLISEIPEFELVGIYDLNQENCKAVAEQYNVKAFSTYADLLTEVEAVDIVTPTLSHFDLARDAIRNFKHIFIEKPVTNTVQEAKSLLDISLEANIKAQVGHVERFNPAFKAAQSYFEQPMFIETHRLAQFNPRGTDVPVVLDLMIHDLDIVLNVVKSNVRKISASGVSVVSETPDIANARLEFDNGCVANLTASRISLKNMRKSRFFQKDAYISVDFLEKKTEIIQMEEILGEPDPFDLILELPNDRKKKILINQPDISESNAIKEELETFYQSIKNDTIPIVPLEDGYNALKVAHSIIDKLVTSNALS
ncbi:MAG: putative dehydrogenase [Parvicellaceae bacterium]|jgi:predicted dehydrogenase